MKTLDLKLTRIGNSKGIRLPVELIKRYGFSEYLAAEVREEGLLLKPKKQTKLSWAETALEMAASGEDWSEWDSTVTDGLETCPWGKPESPAREPKGASLMRPRPARTKATAVSRKR
jgi:antitoxin component of MazEF toxin-antitoxin module